MGVVEVVVVVVVGVSTHTVKGKNALGLAVPLGIIPVAGSSDSWDKGLGWGWLLL